MLYGVVSDQDLEAMNHHAGVLRAMVSEIKQLRRELAAFDAVRPHLATDLVKEPVKE